MQSHSTAEACDKFAAIVHTIETESAIELTRCGKPVAALVSINEYRWMKEGKQDFWDAYTDYCQRYDLQELNIDPEELYGA